MALKRTLVLCIKYDETSEILRDISLDVGFLDIAVLGVVDCLLEILGVESSRDQALWEKNCQWMVSW